MRALIHTQLQLGGMTKKSISANRFNGFRSGRI